MQKRLLITVGGTGGHIFPALAIAKKVLTILPDVEIMFAGGRLADNRYFREAYPFHEIPCGTVAVKKPIKSLFGAFRIIKGFGKSRSLIKEYHPNLVIGFGSFYTLPTLLAAITKNIPILLHEANRYPGKVNRLLSRYALATGIHFEDTHQYLKGSTVKATMPLREDFHKNFISKQEACRYFNLDIESPILLIFGGSQGANTINHFASEAYLHLMKKTGQKWQIIHLTGNEEAAIKIREKYRHYGVQACVKSFEHQMNYAWQAADLAICRAGAGTIAEMTEFEVPALFIPYPHATDNHQEYNADYVVEKICGGKKLLEKYMTIENLFQNLQEMAINNENMKNAIKRYKEQARGQSFLSLIVKTLT